MWSFLIAAAAAILIWGIIAFNRLIRDRERVAQAWSDVGVQLVRRHDLIPKLVQAVSRYASYEGALMEQVTALRAIDMPSSSPAQTAGLEGSLTANLRSLLALAEAYPDLKASAGFLDLQRNLTETETQIQHARRYYNGTVNNLNTRIQTFPDLLVARIFNFLPAEYFEPDPSVSE